MGTMKAAPYQFPDRKTLTHGLTAVFGSNGRGVGVTVLSRQQSLYKTSFPCEMVRCQLPDGKKLKLFCKYADRNGRCSHGQRGGVGYEIEVYRQVLQPSGTSVPEFHGVYYDRLSGMTWLLLEYLGRSLRVGKVSDGLEAMKLAARWIGRFHAINEARLVGAPVPFLTTYDAEYYAGWLRRTARLAKDWRRRFPWLTPFCKRAESALARLAGGPLTVIHGEYYPHNILFQCGTIRPVDWETAAAARGEIDVATLTDGWSKKSSRLLEAEYRSARWPEGAPANFEPTLDLARIYVHLRWLGDQPEWTAEKSSAWRFSQLYFMGKKLGLLKSRTSRQDD